MQLWARQSSAQCSPLTFQDVDGAIGLSDRDKVFFYAYELWWHLIPEVLELTTELKITPSVEFKCILKLWVKLVKLTQKKLSQ